jgi:transcriptional antiterminator NusG
MNDDQNKKTEPTQDDASQEEIEEKVDVRTEVPISEDQIKSDKSEGQEATEGDDEKGAQPEDLSVRNSELQNSDEADASSAPDVSDEPISAEPGEKATTEPNEEELEEVENKEPQEPNEPEEAEAETTSKESNSPVDDSDSNTADAPPPTASLASGGIPSDPDSMGADNPMSSDDTDHPDARWYVIHTASGHENKVAATLKQRIESEHLEHKILDVLVPTQDKIEIRGGKKGTVKEKIFPGYILVKMVLDDNTWLSVRTTPGVTAFVGIGNKPTPIPTHEVQTIVKFMTQGAAPTFKEVFLVNDTVKIIDGPFSEFIGKVDSVDKERGKVRVLVSIFGRETPVELDFLQVQKL